LTTGARLRSLGSNPKLPTYIVFAAVGVLLIALVIRHHVVNQDTLIFILAFAPSVILHEVSHGVVALWCGDDTAKRAGRLTLNPLKHIDPVGSIVVPVVLALSHGPIFGWAKPVPIAVNRLRHPRNQSVYVALAGPATNIILAAIAGVILHELLAHNQGGLVAQIVFEFGIVNVILAIFNLIPIPPLDGSALIERALPASALPTYYQLRMGFMVVVLLVFFLDYNLLSSILVHFETWYLNVVASGTPFSA
jgi:Zn-dependent protease